MSILAHIEKTQGPMPRAVTLLYATRYEPGMRWDQALFLPRLRDVFAHANAMGGTTWSSKIFATGGMPSGVEDSSALLQVFDRRIGDEDLFTAFGDSDLRKTFTYLCGPQGMTDEFVAKIEALGMAPDRIMFEKWW